MNILHIFVKSIYILLASCLLTQAVASTSQTIEKNADKTISKLYHSLKSLHKPSMADRIDWISGQFVDTAYILGALGEGANAHFDQSPRYRTEGFDCETYVTTVLAIAMANNNQQFMQCIKQIRYKKGKVSYLERNHFTSLDWNQNNQKKGFLKDITESIMDKNNQPIAKVATAVIDKPAWYQHKTIKNIKLLLGSRAEQEQRLKKLKEKGAALEIQQARIPYLPLEQLFDQKGQAKEHFFKQIPNAAIIEIVRPNWDLRQTIGTCLNVSHLGFSIWSKGVLYFREASSHKGKVIDIPLIDYLKSTMKSTTIKGINIQVVVPEKPSEKNCDL